MASSGAMPKGLGNAGHDVEVAHGVHVVHFTVAQEAREMENGPSMRRVGHPAHHIGQHVAAAGHDETRVGQAVQHSGFGGFDKIVGGSFW